MAGRLLFTPVAERWVEALHARSQRWFTLAPNGSACHLAFFSMQSELRELLDKDPSAFERLAKLCSECRNPWLAVCAMGFENHPVVQETLRSFGRPKPGRGYDKYWKVLRKVIYHTDTQTMYGDLPLPDENDDNDQPPGPPRPRKFLGPAIPRGSRDEPPSPPSPPPVPPMALYSPESQQIAMLKETWRHARKCYHQLRCHLPLLRPSTILA